MFSHSTMEAKKKIVAQFISQVCVGGDYHMEIDLGANYEIFGEMLREEQDEEKTQIVCVIYHGVRTSG